MEELKQNNDSFIENLKNPSYKLTLIIGIAGIVIGIIASFIFYYVGNKKRDISYQITEPTSLIFDSKNPSSKIKLLESDSIPITENVYLLTGTLWNSGDLPINKEDVRKQLSFEIKGAKRILDFKIVKQKDESVANFNLVKDNSNTLKINWDYFDPKYGFTFQVIYAGEENPSFEILGVVFGISQFNKIAPLSKAVNDRLISGIALYIGFIPMVLFIYVLKKRNERLFNIAIYAIIFTLVICVLSMVYYLAIYNPIPF